LHTDTPKQVHASLGIAYLHPLLGDVTGLDAAHSAQHIHRLKGESLMLAYDESRPARIDGAEELPCTEVAIGDPQLPSAHGGEDLAKQGALLRMAIFTQQDITHQAVRGLIDHQGFARQGAALHRAQGFEAPVTRFKTVAINNVHAVPG
jgi:hypothetical protein